MHKKIIKGKPYYYTTSRNRVRGKGKVKHKPKVIVKYKTLPPKVIIKYKERPSHEPKPSLFSGLFKKKVPQVKPEKIVEPERKIPQLEAPKKDLEFPHLKQEQLLTKEKMIEEGEELVKLSKKYQPKVKPSKVEVEKKEVRKEERAYLSKGERDLSKQQDLLRKKLEGLY